MRNIFSKFAQKFTILLILIIGGIGVQTIISCSGGGDDGGSSSSALGSGNASSSSKKAVSSSSSAISSSDSDIKNYCVYPEIQQCYFGPYSVCPGLGGTLADSCPYSSSSEMPSSSSSIVPSSSSAVPIVPSSSSLASGTSGTFTDSRDSKVYKWVKIGTQIWMAENLNYEVIGSKCYSNIATLCEKYGRLYDWATAMALDVSCNSSICTDQMQLKHKGICPSGWHLSSGKEWGELENFIVLGIGTKLKAKSGWSSDGVKSGDGTDTYGFAALPGGYDSPSGFSGYATSGLWWYAGGEFDAKNAYYRRLSNSSETISVSNGPKSYKYSVRCLQD